MLSRGQIQNPDRVGRGIGRRRRDRKQHASLSRQGANDSVGWIFSPSFSPDGNQVAVFWNRAGGPGTWVISLEDSSQTLVHTGSPMGWTADGQFVYVQEDDSDDMLLVPSTGGEASIVATMPFGNAYCVPVERRDVLDLVCTVRRTVSDAWMIEDFDPTRSP